MNTIVHATSKSTRPWGDALAATLLVLGIVLVGVSLLPHAWMTDRYWTKEDSAAYDRISLEYHRSAYESPQESRRSEADLQAYRQNLRKQYEALRDKLEDAGKQPKRWRRIFLWTGTLVAAVGVSAILLRHPSR